MRTKNNIRVAYVVDEFPSPTETFVANEIRGLRECGAYVAVFALRRGTQAGAPRCPVFYRDEDQPHAPVAGWGAHLGAARLALALNWRAPTQLAYALRNVTAALRFAQIARRKDIHHVHGQFAFTPTDIALMMARAEGLSVSFSAHAWDVYCAGSTLPAKLRHANLCLTCTRAAGRHIESRVAIGERSKICCIHHGTDLERFSFSPRYRPADPPMILAVGRLVPKKGFQTLLYACRRLRQRIPFRCRIVGEGPLRPRLLRLIGELGLQEEVSLPGAVPHQEIPAVYRQADLLAAPSIVAPDGDRDGLPNVVTEAMATGLPVVGSRLSGIPEAIADEHNGLLTIPGESARLADALHRMLTDTALRRRCIDNARRRVEQEFDVRENSRRVYEAIRRAARGDGEI
jgi:glycosyltransferase involved in cell wall biosynthesis